MAPHPWDTASCVSRFWLLWLWPVLLRGSRRPLSESELYDVPSHLSADAIDEQRRRGMAAEARHVAAQKQKQRRRQRRIRGGRGGPSVVRALLRAFGWRYPLVLGVFSVWLGSLMSMPVFADLLLDWLQDPEASLVKGFIFSACLVLGYLVNCNSACQWYQQTTQLGYELRVAAALMVFRRVLRLRVQDAAKDRALNLVQVDAERLYIFAQLSHLPGVAIVVVLAASGQLIHYEGVDVAAVAVSVTWATVLLQGALSRISGPERSRMQRCSDARVAFLSQLLDSFRTLKMYDWLPALATRLHDLRCQELRHAARYLALRAFSSASSYVSPTLSMVAVLAVLHSRGERLTAPRVFFAYAVIGLVRAPLGGMAIGVSAIIDGVAAVRRLQTFVAAEDDDLSLGDGESQGLLFEDEVADPAAVEDKGSAADDAASGAGGLAVDDEEVAVEVAPDKGGGASASSAAAEAPLLRLQGAFSHGAGGGAASVAAIAPPSMAASTGGPFRLAFAGELALFPGELIAVAGRVASGKSSLLLALLGELRRAAGAEGPAFRGRRRVAYLAQPPWIRGATVRDAVLQDLPVDQGAYLRALSVAQLLPDLAAWAAAGAPGSSGAAGDGTALGGRGGASLSGGQRVRLGLAHIVYRCLVSDVRLVLLDDCLSALDARVAKAVVEQVLLGTLLDGHRCVVMVMNSNFAALRAARRMLAVKPGGFVEHFEGGGEAWLAAEEEDVRRNVEQTAMLSDASDKVEEASSASALIGAAPTAKRVSPDGPPSAAPAAEEAEAEDTENRESECAKGKELKIRRSALLSQALTYYLGAGVARRGFVAIALLLLPVLGAEALRVYADHFMGQWAEKDRSLSADDSNSQFHFFVLWAAAAVVAAFLRALLFVFLAVRASHCIHERLLARLVAAPASFLDEMSPGDVLNLLSKDLDALDSLLPQSALDFTQDLVMLLGVFVVIVVTTPPAAAIVVPVLLGFYFVRVFFSRTAREARRLDSAGRSPLYGAVVDACEGLATIRAHGQSAGLAAEFKAMLDRNGKAFFQNYILQPWCILTLDSLGACILCATAVSCVILRASMPPSSASMAITYALMTRGKLQFCIRLSVEAENQLIAVERLLHLEQALPAEADAAAAAEEGEERREEDGQRLRRWPNAGGVIFSGVAMRYRTGLPLVLRGLDLEVAGGSRVGIVGRTGSGKSSLLAAMLRIVELEAGKILIDGVDIRSLPLATLRGAIAVIPQDPVLWTGSVAFNLDPVGEAAAARPSAPPAQPGHLDDGDGASAASAAAAAEAGGRPAKMEAALEAVGLGQCLAEFGGLSGQVEARGATLSLGQRQLFCIARAVYQGRQLVLLDEATSSVDVSTDAAIQKVLRERLRGRTVLVVAHRIATILDADKVAVLEAGVVVEHGAPAALLQGPEESSSRFAALLRASSSEAAK